MTAPARKPVSAMTNAEAVAELRRVVAKGPSCLSCGEPCAQLQCPRCRGASREAPTSRAQSVPALSGADAATLEAEAQTAVIAALTAARWRVWRVGQRNAEGTQDAGVSDLLAFRERLVLIEMKRPVGGRVSAAQQQFADACLAAGVEWRVARGVDDIRDLLTTDARRGPRTE